MWDVVLLMLFEKLGCYDRIGLNLRKSNDAHAQTKIPIKRCENQKSNYSLGAANLNFVYYFCGPASRP